MRDMWISSNGIRRSGTTLKDINILFSKSMTAKEICEPLQSVSIESDVISVRTDLIEKAFDIAGLSDKDGGSAIGYVYTKDLLKGKCKDYKKEFSKDVLISENTPIIQLIKMLDSTNPIKFILNGSNVDEIVSLADLQKPPVRIVLFGLINLLEMNLTAIGQKVYPDGEWKTKIPESRTKYAERILQYRLEANCDTSLFECLQFCDKWEIVLITPNIFNEKLNSSKSKLQSLKEDTIKMRDDLAHGNEISTNRIKNDLESLERLIQSFEKFLEEINKLT
jgi:hypothetical protein